MPPASPPPPDAARPGAPAPASLIAEVRAYVERHRAALRVEVRGGGEALGRQHARAMEGLLRALFAASEARVARRAVSEIALVAVGSFGRGAVALGSDLDVRFLCPNERSRAHAAALADAVLYPLWDAGCAVGHQVVTPAELLTLAEADLPSATSLLDARHLAGDATPLATLVEGARRSIFEPARVAAFVERLRAEVEARHARYGGSVYLLEPDVKNGAGGLRDVDVGWWAAKARWGVGEPHDLVDAGVLVGREADALAAAREALWALRNRLHRDAGRRSDRLTFDRQERLAPELGYGEGGAAVETLMSDYYRHARSIARARETIVLRTAPPPRRKRQHEVAIGGGVRLLDGQTSIADTARLEADPPLALRLYAAAVARGVAVDPFAREAVARASLEPAFAGALRASPEAARLFVDLCARATPTRLRGDSILGEMHEAGLLVAMVPEFAPVVGRVHHDIYHVYTVDVHSVAAVDRLRALARGDLAEEFPLASRIAAEISRPRALYLATLLHDVGKAIGSRDHAARGAEMARAIGTRLGLEPDDTDAVAHLVRVHLAMYHVAARRDLDDPATVAEFAREVHDREGLRELYLLTVADLSTTSPTSMTRWKAKMLDDLYLAVDRFFAEREAPGTGAPDQRVARARAAVVARAPGAAAFVGAMPARYVLSIPPEAVVAHAAVGQRALAAGGFALALAPQGDHDLAELCVAAPDAPGVLASIAAAIVGARLEVHAAQLHSRPLPDGGVQALDLFWVRGPGLEPSERARTLARLERDLASLLAGTRSAADLLAGRDRPRRPVRPSPAVRTDVTVDALASPHCSVIEVTTRDRPALLFTLAQTLHAAGLSVALAKINTEGDKVADVFYVTEAGGQKLAPGRRTADVRAALLAALQRGTDDERSERR